MAIGVAWKWTGDEDDPRWAGVSPADEAALELALRLAAARDDEVVVVTVGPPASERVLRTAVAIGAHHAVRVHAPAGLRSDAVAAALAAAFAGRGTTLVLCGDYSSDRGSGTVPALLAAELGAAQALGAVEVDPRATGPVHVVRRLDGGRREELLVHEPGVVSVEGSVARLRRAGLAAELAARHAVVEVVPGPTGPIEEPADVQPYRPRARALAAPPGDGALTRVRALTTTGEVGGHGEVLVAEPAAAAARIVDALREWGYLDAAVSDLRGEEDLAGRRS
jgi:electron transfer flavoprotein beta subunit